MNCTSNLEILIIACGPKSNCLTKDPPPICMCFCFAFGGPPCFSVGNCHLSLGCETMQKMDLKFGSYLFDHFGGAKQHSAISFGVHDHGAARWGSCSARCTSSGTTPARRALAKASWGSSRRRATASWSGSAADSLRVPTTSKAFRTKSVYFFSGQPFNRISERTLRIFPRSCISIASFNAFCVASRGGGAAGRGGAGPGAGTTGVPRMSRSSTSAEWRMVYHA